MKLINEELKFNSMIDAIEKFGKVGFNDDGVDLDGIALNLLRLNAVGDESMHVIEDSMFENRGYKCVTTNPIYEWSTLNGFRFLIGDHYYKCNENNVPVARLTIKNGSWELFGSRELVESIAKVAKTCYVEVEYEKDVVVGLELTGFTDRGPDFKKVTMKHEKELLPEFYPYLDGGFQELIKEFLISDESILILGGIPGSGKTVGMRETMISLGLRPLIAQDAQAIRHPAFINTFFSVYDSMFNSEVKEENKQYEIKTDWHFNTLKLVQDIMPENKNNNGKVSIEDGRMSIMPSYFMISSRGNASEESEKDKTFKIPEITVEDGDLKTLPIMFVEDADALLVALKDGNELMQNLRNRTDGITKTKPVKIVFTTNRTNSDEFDQPLLRDGRCFGFYPFPLLTPEQAIAARKAAGMEDFEEVPTRDIALATALAKPRKKIFIDKNTKRFFAQ